MEFNRMIELLRNESMRHLAMGMIAKEPVLQKAEMEVGEAMSHAVELLEAAYSV